MVAVVRQRSLFIGLLFALLVIGCSSSTNPAEVGKPAATAVAQEAEDNSPIAFWPGDAGDDGKSAGTSETDKAAKVEKRKSEVKKSATTSKPTEPPSDGGKGDLKKLQGTWRIVDAEYDGHRNMAAEAKKYKWVFQGDSYTILSNDKFAEKWDVKLNPSRSPRTIDSSANIITGAKGRRLTGIYEISGNTLKICYDLTGNGRPDDFKAPQGAAPRLLLFPAAVAEGTMLLL